MIKLNCKFSVDDGYLVLRYTTSNNMEGTMHKKILDNTPYGIFIEKSALINEAELCIRKKAESQNLRDGMVKRHNAQIHIKQLQQEIIDDERVRKQEVADRLSGKSSYKKSIPAFKIAPELVGMYLKTGCMNEFKKYLPTNLLITKVSENWFIVALKDDIYVKIHASSELNAYKIIHDYLLLKSGRVCKYGKSIAYKASVLNDGHTAGSTNRVSRRQRSIV